MVYAISVLFDNCRSNFIDFSHFILAAFIKLSAESLETFEKACFKAFFVALSTESLRIFRKRARFKAFSWHFVDGISRNFSTINDIKSVNCRKYVGYVCLLSHCCMQFSKIWEKNKRSSVPCRGLKAFGNFVPRASKPFKDLGPKEKRINAADLTFKAETPKISFELLIFGTKTIFSPRPMNV